MSLRRAALFAALAASLAFSAGDAFARPGGGKSSGSRGERTYSTPAATPTAPRAAAPMERSVTPQSAVNPGMGAAQRPGFFSGGFGRGLLGGLVGAGLIGMLFGNGLMGGMGGLMSIIGLLLQVALIVLVVKFAIGFFRRRQEPQFAGSSPAQANTSAMGMFGGLFGGSKDAAQGNPQRGPLPGAFGGPAGGGAPQPPLAIVKDDFDMFERRLHEIEDAYSAENIGALRGLATPEMASYFEQEIADNAQRGQVNRIGGVQLLKGDLSESWREPDGEYATVAMQFALTDVMLDRATGAVVSGSNTVPDNVTELWTFRRPAGAGASGWILSAIQQTT